MHDNAGANRVQRRDAVGGHLDRYVHFQRMNPDTGLTFACAERVLAAARVQRRVGVVGTQKQPGTSRGRKRGGENRSWGGNPEDAGLRTLCRLAEQRIRHRILSFSTTTAARPGPIRDGWARTHPRWLGPGRGHGLVAGVQRHRPRVSLVVPVGASCLRGWVLVTFKPLFAAMTRSILFPFSLQFSVIEPERPHPGRWPARCHVAASWLAPLLLWE